MMKKITEFKKIMFFQQFLAELGLESDNTIKILNFGTDTADPDQLAS